MQTKLFDFFFVWFASEIEREYFMMLLTYTSFLRSDFVWVYDGLQVIIKNKRVTIKIQLLREKKILKSNDLWEWEDS